MSQLPIKQKGMTLIGWIIVLTLGISVFVTMIRLIPAYLESMSVSTALTSVAEDSSIRTMSAYKVQDMLAKRLYVNDVKSVSAKDLEVIKDGKQLTLSLKYEVRVPAIGNIDFVLTFDKEATTK